jgi:hypothetical protein
MWRNPRRLLASGLLVVATTVLASAPANAIEQDCRVAVSSVTAFDLQETGQDEIWVYLNDRFFPTNQKSITIALGQSRSFDDLKQPFVTVPAGHEVTMGLLEDDTWPDANDPLGETVVGCGGDQLPIMINGPGYQYQIIYNGFIVPHF